MTICVARFVVRYGKLAEWNDAMGRLLPIMEDQGWKLLASYQTIIGNLHEAYDIWEIPNADAVGAGLIGAASHPDFGTLGADLVDIRVRIPYNATDLVNTFHRKVIVESEDYSPRGTLIEGKIPLALAQEFEEYRVSP